MLKRILIIYVGILGVLNAQASSIIVPGFPNTKLPVIENTAKEVFVGQETILENDYIHFVAEKGQRVYRDELSVYIGAPWNSNRSFLKKTRTVQDEKIFLLSGLRSLVDGKFELRLNDYIERLGMEVAFVGGSKIDCASSYTFLLTADTQPLGCVLNRPQNVPVNLMKADKYISAGLSRYPGYGAVSYYDSGELKLISRDVPLELRASPKSGLKGIVSVRGLLELEKDGAFYRWREEVDYY